MKSIGSVPVHVPGSAVSVSPSTGSPEIVGASVFTGGSASTSAVAGEVALSLPAPFVAVTTTRIAAPTSAAVRS